MVWRPVVGSVVGVVRLLFANLLLFVAAGTATGFVPLVIVDSIWLGGRFVRVR